MIHNIFVNQGLNPIQIRTWAVIHMIVNQKLNPSEIRTWVVIHMIVKQRLNPSKQKNLSRNMYDCKSEV